MTAQYHAIAFDFDGTLVDSAPAILQCIRQVLDAHRIEPVVPLDRELIGPPLPAILAKVAGTDDHGLLDDVTRDFVRFYDGEACLNALVFPGTFETLDELRSRGRSLHLVTNKRGVPTRRMLAHFGWDSLFASAYCLDEHAECADKAQLLAKFMRTDKLFAATTPYVGDTEGDARSASINAMPYIHVPWGYGKLPESIPAQVCTSPSDLLDILLAGTGAPSLAQSLSSLHNDPTTLARPRVPRDSRAGKKQG